MESSQLIRFCAIVLLLLLVTGDYSALFSQFMQSVTGNITDNNNEKSKEPETSSQEQFLQSSNPRRQKPTGFPSDKTVLDIEADIDGVDLKKLGTLTSRVKLLTTIKNACLPKLICELNATSQKEKLTDSEKSLLSLIKDTSISTTAEVTSKYHFAAHMGQLIAGVDGTGCHIFYPTCPFPSLQVLQMMKKVRMR